MAGILISVNANCQEESVRVKCPLVYGELLSQKPSTQADNAEPCYGLDIKMFNDKNVYSNLEGTVSKVIKLKEDVFSVLVRRNNEELYVFSNLEKVNVQPNQKVTMDQNLGILNNSGKLHFEVWQGKTCIPSERIELL